MTIKSILKGIGLTAFLIAVIVYATSARGATPAGSAAPASGAAALEVPRKTLAGISVP